MILLAAVIAGLVAGATGLMIATFRRDDPMLGLIALTLSLLAGIVSIVYLGLDSG